MYLTVLKTFGEAYQTFRKAYWRVGTTSTYVTVSRNHLYEREREIRQLEKCELFKSL